MDYFGDEKKGNNYDYHLYEEEKPTARTSDLYGRSRTGFIQKVYTILSSKHHYLCSSTVDHHYHDFILPLQLELFSVSGSTYWSFLRGCCFGSNH